MTFVALEDGTLVVDQDVPDDSLGPLADALEEMVPPPYRAAAARTEGDVWTAVAESSGSSRSRASMATRST